jgi:acetoin utilization protein AcuC
LAKTEDEGLEKAGEASLKGCKLGVSFGRESLLYSFPGGNPMNASRLALFAKRLDETSMEPRSSGRFVIVEPVAASEEDLLLFHTKEYVERVRRVSKSGEGELNGYDTPGFKGVFEASLYPAGNTLNGLRCIMEGSFDHFFNPVGGLHHAAPREARGFCVFNDSVIAISRALNEFELKSVAYVDIDAHHGDGVYYEFEADPRVVIGDIHEDGKFLYPGTGDESEAGSGFGLGTKLNVGLAPGSGDEQFKRAFDRVEEFVCKSRPEMIFFQCGADGLAGDPIADLRYTSEAHAYASKRLHRLAHDVCGGKILAMGGGGYDPGNVCDAWLAVVSELAWGYREAQGGSQPRAGAREGKARTSNGFAGSDSSDVGNILEG